MKKVIAVILFAMMTLSMVAVGVSAQSMNALGYTPSGTTATVRRADPANVVKDGVLGDGEYDRLSIDTTEDGSFLHLVFGDAGQLEYAEALRDSMEYYASWCDGQINIAVRCRPAVIQQILNIRDGEYPEDWFCRNVAFTISSDVTQEREKGSVCNFYFAVAKRTDNGEYLIGYYGSSQWGNSDSYKPTAGSDFVVNYPGDGTVILEWSIPFAEVCDGGTAAAGDSVYLSIGAEAGTAEVDDGTDFYAVSLGDFTYGVDQRSSENHAAFLLSDEVIESGSGSGNETGNDTGDETGNETTGGGNTPSEGGNTPSEGGNTPSEGGSTPGNTTGGDSTPGNTTGGKTAPKTGDPMIVMAAVAALSAAGAFIVGKKRR